jgi:phospho-N-acetylmuramoyl-pentapeptide-transferase
VFRYITFRTLIAWLLSLTVSLILGPWLIARLQTLQVGQVIRPEGPAGHFSKAGTPTMGGALILFSLTLATLLLADLTNPYVWLALGTTLGFGFIGFVDDYRKLRRHNSAGLIGRYKLLCQFIVATVAAVVLWFMPGFHQHDYDPLLQRSPAKPGIVLHPVRRAGDGGGVECGQPDRRTRRARYWAGDDHRVNLRLLFLRQWEH